MPIDKPLEKLKTLSPGQKRLAVHVSPQGEKAVRSGHPWVFAGSIRKQNHDGQAGDLAVIFDRKDRFLAVGLYDPHSVIRIRVLHQGRPKKIDDRWFAEQIGHALSLRASLPKRGTNGYRLIHGENDGLPGLVVDCYAQVLVIKLYSPAWLVHLHSVLAALQVQQPSERVILRLSRATAEAVQSDGWADGMLLFGPPIIETATFQENGLTFEVDPIHGQKTGFFLDQRENRQRVGDLAQGKSVLNVFAYTGGFSLYAAQGGAQRVTSLDISQPALDAAGRNFALNHYLPSVQAAEHRMLRGDAFNLLTQLQERGEQYDVVIIDPPAFAKKKSEIAAAKSAYARLTHLGLGVLGPGGDIVLASCSSRVDRETFFATIRQAARQAGRPLQEKMRTDHALDHPIGFPEGAYLKCLFAVA